MNLYHISQSANQRYDSYDSAVVAAESEELARNTHPGGGWPKEGQYNWDWTGIENVTVRCIGQAVEGTEAGVICASFNAG
jgi:hypothetical protein